MKYYTITFINSCSFGSLLELGSIIVRTSFSSFKKMCRENEISVTKQLCQRLFFTWSIGIKDKYYLKLPSIVSSGSSSKGIGLSGKLMAFMPSSCSSDTEKKKERNLFSEIFLIFFLGVILHWDEFPDDQNMNFKRICIHVEHFLCQ